MAMNLIVIDQYRPIVDIYGFRLKGVRNKVFD